uniref:Transmembrane protein 65 n=1 Tax=Crocodylus porosus TaxID=8502 RepID=A0A7M4EP36_CROPO
MVSLEMSLFACACSKALLSKDALKTESSVQQPLPNFKEASGEKDYCMYIKSYMNNQNLDLLNLVDTYCPLLLIFFFSVFFHNALPFVGFGFLDNAIMIAAVSLSSNFDPGTVTQCFHSQKHLSACGYLSLAGYVEALASRLGLSIPDLTPKQADMWQTRVSAHLGKAIGVTIGCLLGMFPLYQKPGGGGHFSSSAFFH